MEKLSGGKFPALMLAVSIALVAQAHGDGQRLVGGMDKLGKSLFQINRNPSGSVDLTSASYPKNARFFCSGSQPFGKRRQTEA